MTIATTSNVVVCQGNGIATSFSFSFPVPSASELVVYYTSPTGVQQTLPSNSYSVTGVGSANGGAVTYPLTGTPIQTGSTLTIQRIVPYRQLSSLVNQSGYYPNVVENALDYLTMQSQQLAQGVGLSLQVPLASSAPSLLLPGTSGRSLGLVGFDQSGNAIIYPVPSSVGAGDLRTDTFTAGTDFTPGTTTTLTLSRAPGTFGNMQIHFDAAFQGPDQISSLNGVVLTFNSPIPVGISKVYVTSGSTLSAYVPSSGSVGDGQLSPGNRVYNRAYGVVDPRDFGAKGDGVTDDTTAIQAADTWARAQTPAWRVHFGNGIFMTTGLTFYAQSHWEGQGKATIIRSIIGSNHDVITGSNSAANWGVDGSVATGFPFAFSLRNLMIDGNWNGGSGNTAGSGLTFYGDHCLVEHVYICNCAEHGMRTQFINDSSIDYTNYFLESTFKSIWVDYVGKHGWWDDGPHDSHHIDIHVLDASQSADSTYDGFYFDAHSSARNVSIHPATRAGRLRMRYSVNLQPGSGHEFSGGCNIEGGGVANVGMFGYGSVFDPTTRFYAAWNGINIYMGGTNCSQNVIRGYLQAPPAGRPACVGIQFSTTTGDSVYCNDIDVFMSGQAAGAVYFTAQDGGSNIIRARVYVNANVGIFGTPSPTDDIHVWGTVLGGAHIDINTLDQLYSVSVPSGSTTNITFTYPFSKTPVVEISPVSPGSAMTVPLWLSSRTTSAASIFNGNSSAVTVDVRARSAY